MREGFKFAVLFEVAIGALLLGLLIGVFAFIRTLRYGLSTHDAPTGMEAFLADGKSGARKLLFLLPTGRCHPTPPP